jgi:hypothetical protein
MKRAVGPAVARRGDRGDCRCGAPAPRRGAVDHDARGRRGRDVGQVQLRPVTTLPPRRTCRGEPGGCCSPASSWSSGSRPRGSPGHGGRGGPRSPRRCRSPVRGLAVIVADPAPYRGDQPVLLTVATAARSTSSEGAPRRARRPPRRARPPRSCCVPPTAQRPPVRRRHRHRRRRRRRRGHRHGGPFPRDPLDRGRDRRGAGGDPRFTSPVALTVAMPGRAGDPTPWGRGRVMGRRAAASRGVGR